MPTILRYDFDCGSLGESIWLASTHKEFLIHLSISWRSKRLVTLLVEMTMPLLSV